MGTTEPPSATVATRRRATTSVLDHITATNEQQVPLCVTGEPQGNDLSRSLDNVEEYRKRQDRRPVPARWSEEPEDAGFPQHPKNPSGRERRDPCPCHEVRAPEDQPLACPVEGQDPVLGTGPLL